jgi:hypothetical protein
MEPCLSYKKLKVFTGGDGDAEEERALVVHLQVFAQSWNKKPILGTLSFALMTSLLVIDTILSSSWRWCGQIPVPFDSKRAISKLKFYLCLLTIGDWGFNALSILKDKQTDCSSPGVNCQIWQ